MDLVMALKWIQVSFECYIGISITYGKKQGSCMATVDGQDIGSWLEKIEPGETDHMWGRCHY